MDVVYWTVKNLCAGGTRGFPRWKTPRGGLLWHGSGRGAPSGTTAPRRVSSHSTACAAREWECDVGAVSVVAGTVGGLTSLRRRHGKVRRHARGMSAARDSSPAVRGTDAPGQRVTVIECSVCCYHHIATRRNTPHTHTHSCPRSISLPTYSPWLHRPPTLRQVCRISKLAGLRVIVPAPHVHTIIITHHHHHTPSSRSYVGSTPHALTKHPPPPPPLLYHRQEAVKSGAADGADSTGCHTHAHVAHVHSAASNASGITHPCAPRSSRPVIHRTWATWQGARACHSTAAAV
jgi:hypothetical protein